ncbi:hypothetical protein [Vibrio parahaemolyticus]|uniref:hypothetical protein n=1 Tax=Vibrio parahaemolyticus TaxID=670 RepID=UPI001E4B837F|nr:hypothetical protein [Vibrio parahaemolyticus]
MESKSAKYGLWGTILAALITGAIALYIHYDGKSEKQKEAQEVLSADQKKETANLKVKEIYIPPVNTRLDSGFYAEIANESLLDAEQIEVSINFGSASVIACETLPVNVFADATTFETSFVVFSYDKVKRKEKLHVYCLLSNPSFDSLLITGKNLFSSVEYDRADLDSSIVQDNSSYITFFKVVASIVAVVLIAYFTVVLIMLINKRVEKLGVKFE